MTHEPLVSCIMPTRDRPQFAPLAIEYFRRQTYPAKELIVLDDGEQPVGHLMPEDPQVRYVRLEKRTSLGAKRNLACELAQGEIIAHWDDDDWTADWRLAYQHRMLLDAQADLCGLSSLLFHNPQTSETWRYVYPSGGSTWVAGGTFCFRKDFWRRNPFQPIDIGEDTRFVMGQHRQKVLALPDERFYVAMIHPRNTSPKRCTGARWQRYAGDLAAIMGEDLGRYRRNGQSRAGQPKTSPKVSGERPMKLNLGCCDNLLNGYINVDRVPAPGVTVADLQQPWPWPDGSVTHIRAHDVIEHLADKIFIMNEMWRVLKQGGKAEIVVPTTEGTGAWQDPTHVSFWNRRSFLYYEAGNPYRERFAQHYGIKARFRTLSEQVTPTMDGPKLTIVLQAVK
jgi:glycosyltransferase involved in cell wall biosynthesis